MGLLSSVSSTHTKGVETSTHKKFDLNWSRWEAFVKRVGLPDPFLDGLETYLKVQLVCKFMESVHRGDYAQGQRKGVQGDTVQATIDNVALTFRVCGWDKPARNSRGKVHLGVN
eukprot:13077864-Ditylum_brightwellii.AAC.1